MKIKTGFSASDKKAKEILDSVIGQLSDGIWENSPSMSKYWQNLDIETEGGEIIIVVKDGYGTPYYELSQEERAKKISDFFANKIKQIIKIEKDDGYSSDAANIEWKRDCDVVSDYIGYTEKITVKDCYRVYDKLKGRKDRIKESRNLKESMTANQWVNELSKRARVPRNTILDLWGTEIEDFLINAESDVEFENTLDTFATDIDYKIQELKRLQDNLFFIDYDELKK